jgi:tetratricopeptide (TPR) repeat protein
MTDTDHWHLLRRAEVLADTNRPAEALRVLADISASEPGFAPAHLLAARCLLDMDKPASGLTAANQAAATDPTSVAAQLARSRTYLRLKDHQGALSAAGNALNLAPNSADAHVCMANALGHLGDTKQAFEHADEAVRLLPNAAACHITRSFVAIKARKWRECEASARRALELDPQSSAAMNNLGVAQRHRFRPLSAVQTFAGASRADPAGRLSQGNVNSTILRLGGWVSCLLVTTTILLIWLLGSHPQLSHSLLIALFTVSAVLSVGIAAAGVVWLVRLPRAARSALRDIDAWKPVFVKTTDTTPALIGRVSWHLAIFFGIPLMFALELLWVILESAQGATGSGSRLVEPIVLLTLAIAFRSSRVRSARRSSS